VLLPLPLVLLTFTSLGLTIGVTMAHQPARRTRGSPWSAHGWLVRTDVTGAWAAGRTKSIGVVDAVVVWYWCRRPTE